MDSEIRALIYDQLLRTGTAPSAAEIGDAEALQRLAAGRVLVLDGGGEILMAPPFSAVPTPFAVPANGVRSYGNCIWDALGILAMMRGDGRVETSCGDCGRKMEVAVEEGEVRGDGVIHFAIPARQWWEDIVFT